MPSPILNSRKGLGYNFHFRTICEVHREIYDRCVIFLHDRPEELAVMEKLCEEAYLMGVKLVEKLIAHKLTLPEWEKANPEEALKLRRERVRLLKEMNETGRRLQPQGS